MWSGSGSERMRSITGLNFKGGRLPVLVIKRWGS